MEKTNTAKLIKRLFRFRDKLNLTQQEAAELLGVETRTWQYWEEGAHMPSNRYLALLANYETDPPTIIHIAHKCEFIRKKLGLRKMDMAKIFNVQLNTWGYWERGVMKPLGVNREKIEQMYKELQEPETLRKAS
jgi:DNA-binding transcriptional regulator YiaG